jgi:hypothetical protein
VAATLAGWAAIYYRSLLWPHYVHERIHRSRLLVGLMATRQKPNAGFLKQHVPSIAS